LGEFGGFSLSTGKRRLYPIQVAEKGVCWLRVRFRGREGSGSMPLQGGAIPKMARFIQRLDTHSLPLHVTPPARLMFETMAPALGRLNGLAIQQLLNPVLHGSALRLLGERGRLFFAPLLHNTVSPTMLGGSSEFHVIPGEATVDLDGRLLPGFGPDDLVKEVRAIGGNEGEIEVVRLEPGTSSLDMGLFDTLAGIIKELDPQGVACPLLLSSSTDARHFSRLGIQTYGFLPMSLPEDFHFLGMSHSVDERIPVEALESGARAIHQALQRFGG